MCGLFMEEGLETYLTWMQIELTYMGNNNDFLPKRKVVEAKPMEVLTGKDTGEF